MGSLIGAYFSAYDWHNGSMIALILLVIILVFTLFTDRYSDDDSSREVELNDKKSM
jgi:spermidine/putrescine transport system permease protein